MRLMNYICSFFRKRDPQKSSSDVTLSARSSNAAVIMAWNVAIKEGWDCPLRPFSGSTVNHDVTWFFFCHQITNTKHLQKNNACVCFRWKSPFGTLWLHLVETQWMQMSDGASEQKQQPFHLHQKFYICISEFTLSELDLELDLWILSQKLF